MSWDLIRPSFLYFMNAKPKDLIIGCEVGVDQGYNAVRMIEHCPRLYLCMVDIQPQPYAVGKFCMAHGRAEFHQGKSVDIAKEFKDEYFDYVYIDGDHSYMSVLRDLQAWYGKVKPGGVFAGHDWFHNDVRCAVLDFCKAKKERLFAVNHYFEGNMKPEDGEICDWFLRKQ
jgi:predicted O-methyltransferase YrrM